MRLSRFAIVSAAILAFAAASATASAQAVQKKRVASRAVTERITIIDETGRTRTKITVRPRTFLDPGSESLPFDQHYHDYALAIGRGNLVGDRNDFKMSNSRMPLPGPYDVPGYQY
jgi:hypothetical protein